MNRRSMLKTGLAGIAVATVTPLKLLASSFPNINLSPTLAGNLNSCLKTVTATTSNIKVKPTDLSLYSSVASQVLGALTQTGYFASLDSYVGANITTLAGISLTQAQAKAFAANLPFASPLSGEKLTNFVATITDASYSTKLDAWTLLSTNGSANTFASITNWQIDQAAGVSNIPNSELYHLGNPCPDNFGCKANPQYNCQDAAFISAMGATISALGGAEFGVWMGVFGAWMSWIAC